MNRLILAVVAALVITAPAEVAAAIFRAPLARERARIVARLHYTAAMGALSADPIERAVFESPELR